MFTTQPKAPVLLQTIVHVCREIHFKIKTHTFWKLDKDISRFR